MENNQMPGGYLVGDSHANGGIKIKTPEGQIEAEGGEVIINKRALALEDKYVCEGTPKEMTSKINEMEGGVSWSKTGSCRLVRQAADGTQIEEEASIADDGFGLLYTKNNKTYIITTDTKDQLEIVEMALNDFKDGLIDKDELENTLQSNINEEVEFTTHIDMISGKPFAYDQFYGGYIELMSREPINIDYSSAMAKDGKKIEDSFTADSNGNYMNTQGYQLIDNFDGMYQVLDPKGMDIVGEYLTLEDGMQAIKDYMENSNVESEFSETEKAALGSFIFGKEYKIENDKPFRIEVKNKISDMEREYDLIKKDYRYGILDAEEYLELKKELVDKYAAYINVAERLDIVVNRGIFMGLQKEKDIPTDKASSGTILRSSNPEKRPSPSVSATIYPAGYKMEGNDGNTWEIALDSRGIHRWKRVKAEDGMSMAEDGKSMFPKSQINYGFNYLNIDGNLVNYSYTFYKENGPVCDVYFDVTIGAEDRTATDFSFDYSSERTYSKDYIVTEMVAVEYNIVDYIEMGEEPSSDTRVSLSQEDISRVSSEIDAIYREKIEGKAQPINEILTKEEKNNILASNKLAANGKQISKCDCGCGVAKDGAEVSSCGCSHSKYKNGGGVGEPKKIKVAFYKWGEYQGEEEIYSKDLPEVQLGDDDLEGFTIRDEDANKNFYAEDRDIDSDDDGTSVKRAFATDEKYTNGGKVDYYKDKQSGRIVTEQEMLDMVDEDDQLDSFYLIGSFSSKDAYKDRVVISEIGSYSNEIDAKKVADSNNKFFKETNQPIVAEVISYPMDMRGREVKIIKVVAFKKEKYKNGGGVDGGVKYIPYKDEEIMYEPTYNKYYVNDEEFDSLKEAQNYIDGGSPMSAQTINAYRHGAFANGGGILSRIQAAEAERLAKRENELKKIEAIQPLIDEIYNKDKSAYGLDPDQDTDVFVINFKSKDGNNYALLFRYIKMNQYVTGTGSGPFNRKNLGPEDIEERLSFGQVELYKVDSTLDFMDIKNVEEIYSSNHPIADTAFTPIFDKIAGEIIDLKGDDLRIAMEIESAEYKNDYYANGGGIGNVKIEIKPQYYDEKDNRENVALKYDVNYLITFDNKDFIELTGTLKPYHTGRDYEYEFEPSWFADDTESNYYEENSEKIEKEILDKFYSTTFANGGGVNDGKELWFSPSGEVKAEAKGTARKYIERHLAKRFGAESMELVGEDEKDYIYELNGNPMMIAAKTAILEEENGLEVESYGRKKRVHIPKSGIDQTSVHLRYPLITPFKNGGGVGNKNKYQTAKEYFEGLYSKMNSNQKSIYNKEYTRLAKYFGDDESSFSDKDVAEYIESTINELVDSDYKLQAHSITIPFFKLGHKYIAYWNAYKQPEWWDGNEYKAGGSVGRKRHLYAIMMGKYSQMDNPQYVEVSGRDMDEAMSKFKQMGVDAVPEHIHFSNKPPYYYKNGGGLNVLVPYIESKAEKWYYRLKESDRIHFSKKYPRNNNETNEDWFQRVWIESGKSIGIKRNKYANGGGLDADDFEMDNSTYTIRMWDTDMDKLNRVEPLQMTYKIKSQALDLANRFHYENNYGIVEVEDENGNRILTLDAYAANGKSISMNVTECERCHQPTDNVTTMSMFNEDVICMSCKEKERKNPHYEKAHAADIEQIKQGNYNYEGMGMPDEEAADGKPIQEADYLTNAMLSVLDLKNYLDSHNDQIIINGSKYNYYSHGQYNLRVTGGQGAIYNIIPYFPETTVGQLQNAKFYTLLRKLKTYSFAISVDGLVLDVAEDGLAIA